MFSNFFKSSLINSAPKMSIYQIGKLLPNGLTILCLSNPRHYLTTISFNVIQTRLISSNIKKMSSVSVYDYDVIGFDLDHTLARYNIDKLLKIEYDILSKLMMKKLGFQEMFKTPSFNKDFLLRGLILDDVHGNVLKIAYDGSILKASHGTKMLNDNEIDEYYPNHQWNVINRFIQEPLQGMITQKDKIFPILDYFHMPAILIFAKAVDGLDCLFDMPLNEYGIIPKILECLREMFDETDFINPVGEFINKIKTDPATFYQQPNTQLLKWLKTLKNGKKKLILITNAPKDLASHIANHVFGLCWNSVFDFIVADAKKPNFFKDCNTRKFVNITNSPPTILKTLNTDQIHKSHWYTEGNWSDLNKYFKKLLGRYPKYLFFGDNLLHDIYPPNNYSTCDTVTICEEMQAEGLLSTNGEPHPCKDYLTSPIWGSYYSCNEKNKPTYWAQLMKDNSILQFPSMDYLIQFNIKHRFPVEM